MPMSAADHESRTRITKIGVGGCPRGFYLFFDAVFCQRRKVDIEYLKSKGTLRSSAITHGLLKTLTIFTLLFVILFYIRSKTHTAASCARWMYRRQSLDWFSYTDYSCFL